MNANDVRHWLMQAPKPAIVRVTTDDDQQHDLACGPQANVGWKKLAATIVAYEWHRLEALDPDMKLIRATNNVDTDDEDEDEDRTSRTVRPPMAPPPPNADPETLRFHLFANLIAEAYRHATETAFDRLTDLIQSMNDRAIAGDQQRETFFRAQIRGLEAQIRALGKEPVDTGNGDLIGSIVSAIAGGMGAAQHANGASNGKVDEL